MTDSHETLCKIPNAEIRLLDLVVHEAVSGFKSKREARERIKSGAVKIDGEVVTEAGEIIDAKRCGGAGLRLQIGRKKRFRITNTDDLTFAQRVTKAIADHGERAIFEPLAVSRQTVQRWAAGTAAPHPRMRAPVFALITRLNLAAQDVVAVHVPFEITVTELKDARSLAQLGVVGPVQSGTLRRFKL